MIRLSYSIFPWRSAARRAAQDIQSNANRAKACVGRKTFLNASWPTLIAISMLGCSIGCRPSDDAGNSNTVSREASDDDSSDDENRDDENRDENHDRLITGPENRNDETSSQDEATESPVVGYQETDPLDGNDGRELSVRHFRPQSQLRVSVTDLRSARYPVVDVHTHFRNRTHHSKEMLDDFVALMDAHQIAICVSMDAVLGPNLDEHLDYLWSDYPDRFVAFAHIDWQGDGSDDDPSTWACQRDDFVRHTVEHLKLAKTRGISGLKVFKSLGLGVRDANGDLHRIDDERWDPIWRTCGELGLPVLIHSADPAAFFLPIDGTNERWEELSRHPDWSFHGSDFPSRAELLEARNRVIERHPETIFIAAHVANNAEDLETVSQWLDEYPNMYVEFASRISELGRQPYTARRFLIDYQQRVLFGTDGPWPEERITYYWRFLETFDEYFPYSEKVPPPQGLWYIYGVGLPDETLQAIYFENAQRLIPGIRDRYEKFVATPSD